MCFWSRADIGVISQRNASFLVDWSKCCELTWLHGLWLPLFAGCDFSRIRIPSGVNSLSSSSLRAIINLIPSHQVCRSGRYLVASLLSPQNWNVAGRALRTRPWPPILPARGLILTKVWSVHIWHLVYWRNRFKLATLLHRTIKLGRTWGGHLFFWVRVLPGCVLVS